MWTGDRSVQLGIIEKIYRTETITATETHWTVSYRVQVSFHDFIVVTEASALKQGWTIREEGNETRPDPG